MFGIKVPFDGNWVWFIDLDNEHNVRMWETEVEAQKYADNVYPTGVAKVEPIPFREWLLIEAEEVFGSEEKALAWVNRILDRRLGMYQDPSLPMNKASYDIFLSMLVRIDEGYNA